MWSLYSTDLTSVSFNWLAVHRHGCNTVPVISANALRTITLSGSRLAFVLGNHSRSTWSSQLCFMSRSPLFQPETRRVSDDLVAHSCSIGTYRLSIPRRSRKVRLILCINLLIRISIHSYRYRILRRNGRGGVFREYLCCLCHCAVVPDLSHPIERPAIRSVSLFDNINDTAC